MLHLDGVYGKAVVEATYPGSFDGVLVSNISLVVLVKLTLIFGTVKPAGTHGYKFETGVDLRQLDWFRFDL